MGWWDRNDPTLDCSHPARLFLINSEIHEAYDDIRNGREPQEIYHEDDGKPCGVPIELADAWIRIMDYAEANEIDLIYAVAEKMRYNMTRPYRHGGKTS